MLTKFRIDSRSVYVLGDPAATCRLLSVATPGPETSQQLTHFQPVFVIARHIKDDSENQVIVSKGGVFFAPSADLFLKAIQKLTRAPADEARQRNKEFDIL